jgi:hypothetical protein
LRESVVVDRLFLFAWRRICRRRFVINVTELARRLGSVVGAGRSGLRVTPAEVLAYLRPQDTGRAALELGRDRRELDRIGRVVASLPQIVAEERLARRHPGFRRYFEALPRIVFFYGRGYSADEIASEMSFIATGFGVEAVMDIVAQTIARRLAQAA